MFPYQLSSIAQCKQTSHNRSTVTVQQLDEFFFKKGVEQICVEFPRMVIITRMNDDEDLYGDLAHSAAEAEIEALKQSLERSEKDNEALKAEVGQLKQQIVALVDDKTTLERNIVSIYNTALREIKRKDAEIASLRQQVSGPSAAPRSSTS